MANRLTEKEEMVLRAIVAESNFNYDSLDMTKHWNEQSLENPDTFSAFADVKDYGCGMDKAQTRAVFGSLVKKGCIRITKDDSVFGEPPCYWLTINKEQFNKIKEYLA